MDTTVREQVWATVWIIRGFYETISGLDCQRIREDMQDFLTRLMLEQGPEWWINNRAAVIRLLPDDIGEAVDGFIQFYTKIF